MKTMIRQLTIITAVLLTVTIFESCSKDDNPVVTIPTYEEKESTVEEPTAPPDATTIFNENRNIDNEEDYI